MHFVELSTMVFCFTIHWGLFWRSRKCIQGMAWGWTNDKPFPVPIMTNVYEDTTYPGNNELIMKQQPKFFYFMYKVFRIAQTLFLCVMYCNEIKIHIMIVIIVRYMLENKTAAQYPISPQNTSKLTMHDYITCRVLFLATIHLNFVTCVR